MQARDTGLVPAYFVNSLGLYSVPFKGQHVLTLIGIIFLLNFSIMADTTWVEWMLWSQYLPHGLIQYKQVSALTMVLIPDQNCLSQFLSEGLQISLVFPFPKCSWAWLSPCNGNLSPLFLPSLFIKSKQKHLWVVFNNNWLDYTWAAKFSRHFSCLV